jgi:aminopeptidase N
MRKCYLLLCLLGLVHYGIAQTESSCAELKKKFHSQLKKKTRAGNYDNSLMNKYDVKSYFLDLNIERNSTVISGAVTIRATVTSIMLDTFCFELNSGLTIDSITFGNQSLAFTRVNHITYAILNAPAIQTGTVQIRIAYHGDASVVGGAAIGDGFATDTSPSWGNEVSWSLSQPYSAYEWFPCKQFLQDKADSARIYITTSEENMAGSNGVLEGIDSLPNNKLRYRWVTNYAIDYYLISVAVSKYVDYTIYAHPINMPNDSIRIQNFIYDNPNTLTFFKTRLDTLPMLIEYFSEKLGLYPFANEKYGHCMAPIGGGMEHQTMTTQGNFSSLAVTAHELFHQWFGDHVTCKTWKDIYVNEGMASYGEYLAYEKFRSYASAQSRMLNVHNDILQEPDATVYFTDTTNVNRIFDGIQTYDKGGAVTHTLRFLLGDSIFFQAMRDYQTQFSFSTASILDWKTVAETTSGMNLDDYFDQWIFGSGHPEFSVEYHSDGNAIFLKVDHTTSSTATTLFRTPLELRCQSASGDTVVRVNVTQNSNTFMLPSNKIITGITIDPNNWLLNTNGTIVSNPALQALQTEQLALENALEIYPNPTTDHVTIRNQSNEPVTYRLQDAFGRWINEGTMNQWHNLNLSPLSPGVYILQVEQGGYSMSRKIVKWNP